MLERRGLDTGLGELMRRAGSRRKAVLRVALHACVYTHDPAEAASAESLFFESILAAPARKESLHSITYASPKARVAAASHRCMPAITFTALN